MHHGAHSQGEKGGDDPSPQPTKKKLLSYLDLIELEKEKENEAIALPRIKVNGDFSFALPTKTHYLIASFTHTLLINYTLSLIPTRAG